jgi:hypothetical protein
MNIRIILFLPSHQIHLINSFQNVIFITLLVKSLGFKLVNKAWENLKIHAMIYSLQEAKRKGNHQCPAWNDPD